MDVGQVLRETALCEGLSTEQVDKMAELAEVESRKAGEVIFEEDGTGRDLYILMDGRVAIEAYVPGETDRTQTIVTVLPGNLLGEFSLLDGAPRSATARVVDQAQILRISHDKLMSLMEHDNEIGYKVILNIAQLLTTRIRNTNLRFRNATIWGA